MYFAPLEIKYHLLLLQMDYWAPPHLENMCQEVKNMINAVIDGSTTLILHLVVKGAELKRQKVGWSVQITSPISRLSLQEYEVTQNLTVHAIINVWNNHCAISSTWWVREFLSWCWFSCTLQFKLCKYYCEVAMFKNVQVLYNDLLISVKQTTSYKHSQF